MKKSSLFIICNFLLISVIAPFFICMLFNSCAKDSAAERSDKAIQQMKLFPVKFEENSPWVYVDSKGEVVLENTGFHMAEPFIDGVARVSRVGRQRQILFGLINEKGEYLIPPGEYCVSPMSDGYSWCTSPDKIGVIDKTGKFVFQQDKRGFLNTLGFNELFFYTFNNGVSVVCGNNSEFCCIPVDTLGHFVQKNSDLYFKDCEVIYNKQDSIRNILSKQYHINGIHPDGDLYSFQVHAPTGKTDYRGKPITKIKYGWCDKNGKVVIEPQFDAAHLFLGSDRASVVKGTDEPYRMYIDRKGNELLAHNYPIASPFYGDVAIVGNGHYDYRSVTIISGNGDYLVGDFYFMNKQGEIQSPVFHCVPIDLVRLTNRLKPGTVRTYMH